jgi:hypothetical protein
MATRTRTHPKNRLSDPVTVGNKKVEKKEDSGGLGHGPKRPLSGTKRLFMVVNRTEWRCNAGLRHWWCCCETPVPWFDNGICRILRGMVAWPGPTVAARHCARRGSLAPGLGGLGSEFGGVSLGGGGVVALPPQPVRKPSSSNAAVRRIRRVVISLHEHAAPASAGGRHLLARRARQSPTATE